MNPTMKSFGNILIAFVKISKEKHEVKDIASFYNIEASRKAYRACGKDPTRYRLSSESLLRRVLKGKGLYKVNNIVDINNLLSLKYHYSIGPMIWTLKTTCNL